MADYEFTTDRLLLRRLKLEDAPHIVTFAGDYDVAKMTLNIPHPYPPDEAMPFIKRSYKTWEEGTAYSFAIVLGTTDIFMGVIGLRPHMQHRRADVGYWIGKSFWGHGYMTEALERIIQFGFEDLDLNRIDAGYRVDNSASGRVMEKAGMEYEGTFRQYAMRDDEYMDLSYRAILRENYKS